ncbi:MAG: hypothetical protein JSV82_00590, partial [Planctomycetota bacterium]
MKKLLTLTLALLLVAVFVHQAIAATTVTVVISPDTVVLEENVSEYVLTAHVGIAYNSVLPDSVELDGIPADLVKPDLRDELVAKFNVPISKLPPGQVTFTLSGATENDTFSGSDTIS